MIDHQSNRQTFHAVLEKGDRALGWTIASVPFDPSEVWPQRTRLRVAGTINGFAFRTSLFPEPGKQGTYYLLVNRAMQEGGRASLGSLAAFVLEPDLEERPAELPEELDALLDEAEGLRAWYQELTEYTRREIGKWIAGVKSEEARLRRAQSMAERLLATMEAEVELPPAIAKALASRPGARGLGEDDGVAAAKRTDGRLLLPGAGGPGEAHRETLRDGGEASGAGRLSCDVRYSHHAGSCTSSTLCPDRLRSRGTGAAPERRRCRADL